MIPFAPPRIDQRIIDEVVAVLKSGWITTGPKVREFETQLTRYYGSKATVCLNSATAGLELMLRWFGVSEGDEVIIPAYTYTSTANVVVHCGAVPIMVDIDNDFNIGLENIRKAITGKTKVIMPVDFGGFPCDYDAINLMVRSDEIKSLFIPNGEVQEKLGRIMVLSDAAHSLGAVYKGKKTGSLTDVTVFSFHAVKNLTTAEGGAIALNLPESFDNLEVYKFLCVYSLHGQNKDALAKLFKGNWKYDIITAGYKCNMTDIAAAIGLVELSRYDDDMIKARKVICKRYSDYFSSKPWAQTPLVKNSMAESSYHLYPLRIEGICEAQRDMMVDAIFDNGVAVNVHFIPLPMLTFYKSSGYKIEDFPNSYKAYSGEISLPVYYGLTMEQVDLVCSAVNNAVEKILEFSN